MSYLGTHQEGLRTAYFARKDKKEVLIKASGREVSMAWGVISSAQITECSTTSVSAGNSLESREKHKETKHLKDPVST